VETTSSTIKDGINLGNRRARKPRRILITTGEFLKVLNMVLPSLLSKGNVSFKVYNRDRYHQVRLNDDTGWSFVPINEWRTNRQKVDSLEVFMLEIDDLRWARPQSRVVQWMMHQQKFANCTSPQEQERFWHQFVKKTTEVLEMQKVHQFTELNYKATEKPPLPAGYPELDRWENIPTLLWVCPVWSTDADEQDRQAQAKRRLVSAPSAEQGQSLSFSWWDAGWYWSSNSGRDDEVPWSRQASKDVRWRPTTGASWQHWQQR